MTATPLDQTTTGSTRRVVFAGYYRWWRGALMLALPAAVVAVIAGVLAWCMRSVPEPPPVAVRYADPVGVVAWVAGAVAVLAVVAVAARFAWPVAAWPVLGGVVPAPARREALRLARWWPRTAQQCWRPVSTVRGHRTYPGLRRVRCEGSALVVVCTYPPAAVGDLATYVADGCAALAERHRLAAVTPGTAEVGRGKFSMVVTVDDVTRQTREVAS